MAYQFVFKRYELKYLMTRAKKQRIHEANKRMTERLIRRFPGAEGYLILFSNRNLQFLFERHRLTALSIL